MNQACIVLSAVFASPDELEWAERIARSDLTQKFHFEIVVTSAQRARFADTPVVVHVAASAAALKATLHDVAPAMIQTFSGRDHSVAVRYRFGRFVYVAATHCRADQAIRQGLRAKFVYNRQTDLNIFTTFALQGLGDTAGMLGLKRPLVLEQPHLGADCELRMLEHAYSSLLQPTRRDILGNQKRDFSDIRLTYITHFYCNQQDISAVTNLLERYAAYPPELLARVQFVIVDDGSPIQYEVPDFPLNLLWLKIDQDIRWNQPGARNLAAVYAKSDMLLLADLDHEVPAESMRRLVERGSCGKRFYKMRRRDSEGRLYKGHPNLFVMSRGRFFECFGYDEEFSGHYASDDYRFVKYQRGSGSLQTYLPSSIYCIERTDIDRNKSYHSLKRDLSFNSPSDSRKARELSDFGHGYGHSRMFLSDFTWTKLADRHLDLPVARRQDRSWKPLSLLWQVMPRF